MRSKFHSIGKGCGPQLLPSVEIRLIFSDCSRLTGRMEVKEAKESWSLTLQLVDRGVDRWL